MIAELNMLSLNEKENTWLITTTQRGKPKLFSNGYGYVVDKIKNKTYWKCDKKDCCGRGISSADLKPPLSVTQAHSTWHIPDVDRSMVAQKDAELKAAAVSTKNKPRTIIKEIFKDTNNDVLSKVSNDRDF